MAITVNRLDRFRRYEGKGPLNIDAEIEAARNAALAKRRRLRTA
jgi:hypothetical protein